MPARRRPMAAPAAQVLTFLFALEMRRLNPECQFVFFTAVAWFHGSVIAQSSTSSSQSNSIPFIGGGYKLVYSYDEVRGDVGRDNACTGTFPYQMTWLIDIYQNPNNPGIRFCISGTDCSEKYWDGVTVQANRLARQVGATLFCFLKCTFKRS